jgi:DNA-binding NtrC family response regulator
MAQQEANEIFLLDNEIADLELICNALRKEGYKVLPTSGYRSGIHRFRLYSGCFDSLVTAVSLPSEASCELAKTLLVLHPSLKVIFVSRPSEAAVWNLDQILGQRAHFLEKPIDLDEFISLVRLIRGPRLWVRTMNAASVA